MGNLASLTFRLGANINDFQTKMRKASKVMKSTGDSMKRMGKSMSMYVTAPMVALGTASVAAFEKQAQAEAKLSAQIAANGKNVATTMAQYKEFASALQAVTTVGDETTLELMQMAETMGATDVKEATKGAIGLSKALGIDLQTAIKMTVLAQKGEYTMLQRYVPALRNANTETEKAAIVSKLYADGMKIAQTEAKTGIGPMIQLKNSMGDLMEEIGGLIAEAITPLVNKLRSFVAFLQNLSPKAKRIAVVIAGITAAIGPLLLAIGSLLTVLPAIGAAFTALTGPVGLVIAAIAGIAAAFVYVYDNWEAFKERLTNWDWLRNAAIDAFIGLIKVSSFFLNEITKLFGVDFVAPVVEELEKLKAEPPKLTTEFKSFGDSMKNVATQVMNSLDLLGSKVKQVRAQIIQTKLATRGVANITQNGNDGIILRGHADVDTDEAIKSLDELETGLTEADATTQAVSSSLSSSMEQMGNDMVSSFNMAEHGFEGFMKRMMSTVIKLIAMMLSQSLAQAISGATASGLSTGPGAVFTTPAFIATAIAGVLSAFAAIPKFAKGGIVPDGFPNDTYLARLTSGEIILPKDALLTKSIKTGNNSNTTKNISSVFNSIPQFVGGAISNSANSISNTTKNISSVFSSIPQFINGGIVPDGFPNDTYLARLTSGETILPAGMPLSGAAGNLNINVTGRLVGSGNDLIAVIDKAQYNRNRINGK